MQHLKLFLLSIIVVALSFPLAAQEGDLELIPISGSLDYVPEMLLFQEVGAITFFDATETEVWAGDFAGNATAQDRIMIRSSGVWEAWIVFEFEGTVLGDYEGSMIIMSVWKREAASADWHGEWVILTGTGDLENIHGFGVGWGPGFDREDPQASPDIFYSGEVSFIEISSE